MCDSPTSLIFEPLARFAADRPAAPALGDATRSLDYGGFWTDVCRQAAALRRRGVAPGDRVVLAAANSVTHLVTHFAILRSGAVSVPLAAQATAERIAFVADDCDARLVLRDTAGGSALTLADLAAESVAGSPLEAPADRRSSDLCCLMYTTGATGRPKGVMLSHASLGQALANIVAYLGYDGTQREAVVLPLSHSFGLGHAYCTLLTGGFVWVADGLRAPRMVLDALPDHAITAMPTTPAMLRLLLGPYRAAFVPRAAGLRLMVVNSEPLPVDLARDLMTALPDLDVVVYYGLTEASRSSFLRLRAVPDAKLATVGTAAPNVVLDVFGEDGAPVPAGAVGEVRIAGPHLALGYWRRPEEQAAAFAEGWLRTGDLGTLDGDGFLTITGRIKDQINVGGLKVAAAEVEAVLRRHPQVADVAVIGVPDPSGMQGEAVAAAIVRRDPALDERAMALYCDQWLEPYMRPKLVRFVGAIPRAETGKILRAGVRDILEAADAGSRA